MVVITASHTSNIEYDVKALFSELAIHCFLYKVLSPKVWAIYASKIVLRWKFPEFLWIAYDRDKDKLCILLFQRNFLQRKS